MFDKWLKLPAHYYLHITALSLLCVGVALSNVLMSIGTIWIIANWLIEMDFKAKWERFKSNKLVIAISLFFILMLISLTWTQDLQYGFKDLLTKLPFITIPLVMGTIKPLEQKVYRFLLYLLLASLTFTTVFNFIRFNTHQFADIRQMSFFISHIRLGGLICMTIFLMGYETYKKQFPLWVSLPVGLWLLFYVYQSQTLTAYVLFLVLIFVSLFYILKAKWRLIFGTILIGIGSITTALFYQSFQSPKAPQIEPTKDLVYYTVNGNSYYHDTTSTLKENGHLIWRYVCIKELRTEWNKVSEISYDSLDAKKQPLYGTLVRYMSSRGLRKDSVDFQKLTDTDIKNIELGKANYIDKSVLQGKMSELYLDYLIYAGGGDPNGHSFIQRIEHFKTAVHLIQANWLFGVGLGDVKLAFEKQYELEQSQLNIENRHRSHNQFLTNWITLGILGFVLSVFMLFYPFFSEKRSFPLIIVSISLIFGFFTQDLIETQAGVTIFALFYSLVNFKEHTNGKIG